MGMSLLLKVFGHKLKNWEMNLTNFCPGDGVNKSTRIHPSGTLNICTKLDGVASNSGWDSSNKTKNLMVALEEKSQKII